MLLLFTDASRTDLRVLHQIRTACGWWTWRQWRIRHGRHSALTAGGASARSRLPGWPTGTRRPMLATVFSRAVHGVDAYTVLVEVGVQQSQMYAFAVVGLPDTAVQEARERVRSALKNSGYTFPAKRITINLTVSGEVGVGVAAQ